MALVPFEVSTCNYILSTGTYGIGNGKISELTYSNLWGAQRAVYEL